MNEDVDQQVNSNRLRNFKLHLGYAYNSLKSEGEDVLIQRLCNLATNCFRVETQYIFFPSVCHYITLKKGCCFGFRICLGLCLKKKSYAICCISRVFTSVEKINIAE